MNEETPRRCAALTQAGQPCKNRALPGSTLCRVHQAVATQAEPPAPAAAAAVPAEPQAPSAAVPAEPPAPAAAVPAEPPAPAAAISSEPPAPAAAAPTEPPAPAAAVPTEPPTAPPPQAAAEEISPEALLAELAAEIEALTNRVRAALAEELPSAGSRERPYSWLKEIANELNVGALLELLRPIRRTIREDLLNIDTWKGLWFIINYSLSLEADRVKRRLRGEYETDEWGVDRELIDLVQPFLTFMYRRYWRVQTSGIEHIPAEGRCLLVANHSGQLPWDGVMVGTAVYLEHPAQRLVRTLYANWFPTLPVLSALFVRLGQTLATVENGTRLLEEDQLVAVYPEGYKGVGKLFRERYRLARFGRGGFIKMALRTAAPIVPVSVVGAEETYISLYKSPTLARLTGFPYFPISPTFPWLGLLGFIPLPTKWYIDFGEPIPMAGYGADAAENVALVSQLTDQVRNVVQEMIYRRLAQRRSVFFG